MGGVSVVENDPLAAGVPRARWVLERRAGENGLSAQALRLGAEYFLKEFPMFMETVGILEPASVFCYHQCPMFVRDLLHDRYGPLVSPGQGFVVVAARSWTASGPIAL